MAHQFEPQTPAIIKATGEQVIVRAQDGDSVLVFRTICPGGCSANYRADELQPLVDDYCPID